VVPAIGDRGHGEGKVGYELETVATADPLVGHQGVVGPLEELERLLGESEGGVDRRSRHRRDDAERAARKGAACRLPGGCPDPAAERRQSNRAAPDRYRPDDAVGARVDPRQSRGKAVGHPHRGPGDRQRVRGVTDRDSSNHRVGPRVDARDGVIQPVGHPYRAQTERHRCRAGANRYLDGRPALSRKNASRCRRAGY
jgi:hypothetical protein